MCLISHNRLQCLLQVLSRFVVFVRTLAFLVCHFFALLFIFLLFCHVCQRYMSLQIVTPRCLKLISAIRPEYAQNNHSYVVVASIVHVVKLHLKTQEFSCYYGRIKYLLGMMLLLYSASVFPTECFSDVAPTMQVGGQLCTKCKNDNVVVVLCSFLNPY